MAKQQVPEYGMVKKRFEEVEEKINKLENKSIDGVIYLNDVSWSGWINVNPRWNTENISERIENIMYDNSAQGIAVGPIMAKNVFLFPINSSANFSYTYTYKKAPVVPVSVNKKSTVRKGTRIGSVQNDIVTHYHPYQESTTKGTYIANVFSNAETTSSGYVYSGTPRPYRIKFTISIKGDQVSGDILADEDITVYHKDWDAKELTVDLPSIERIA